MCEHITKQVNEIISRLENVHTNDFEHQNILPDAKNKDQNQDLRAIKELAKDLTKQREEFDKQQEVFLESKRTDLMQRFVQFHKSVMQTQKDEDLDFSQAKISDVCFYGNVYNNVVLGQIQKFLHKIEDTQE